VSTDFFFLIVVHYCASSAIYIQKGAFPGHFGPFRLASETAYILFLQRIYV